MPDGRIAPDNGHPAIAKERAGFDPKRKLGLRSYVPHPDIRPDLFGHLVGAG